MDNNSFMRGTLILLVTSIILKVMGFLYQIVIVRFVGTESIGLLNMAFPFYIALVVIATAGIPVALAKMVAELLARGRYCILTKVLQFSFLIVIVLSVICAVLAVVVMPQLFQYVGSDERIIWCFYVMIPGILLVPLASIIRGYFQGVQKMLYPSYAQILEQIVRLLAGMIFVVWLKPYGVLFVAAGLAGAMMLGELAGLLLILYFYFKTRRQQRLLESSKEIVHSKKIISEIASYGVPTTFTRLTSSIDMAIEASLVPFCLITIGYNFSQAASIYGQISGVAISLITIPMVLTSSLATALVPAIAEAAANHRHDDLSKKCSQSLRLTYIFSLPVIIILFLCANDLGILLFHINGIGEMVRILAAGAIFMYIGQTAVGILQGLGRTKTVFINNFIGSSIKLMGIYYFVVIAQLGVNGIALAFVFGYGIQATLDVVCILPAIKIKFTIAQLIVPLFCGFVMIEVLFWLQRWLIGITSANMTIMFSVGGSGICYMILLVLCKQFRFSDLK